MKKIANSLILILFLPETQSCGWTYTPVGCKREIPVTVCSHSAVNHLTVGHSNMILLHQQEIHAWLARTIVSCNLHFQLSANMYQCFGE